MVRWIPGTEERLRLLALVSDNPKLGARDQSAIFCQPVSCRRRDSTSDLSLRSFILIIMQGGDDLEDDFVPDETVALSGDEGFGTTHLDEEDVFVDDGDDVEQDAEDEDEYDAKDALSTPAANGDPAIIAKKRKRREKEKEKKAKVCPSETSFVNADHDLCK